MKKLKSHAKSIIAISIALLVLISISGVNIYTHHCNTSQTNNYSLFFAASACEMDALKPQAKSCCQSETENILEKYDTKSEKWGCCTDHSKLVKIDTQTVLNHTTPIIKVHEMQSPLVLMAFNAVGFEGFYTAYLHKNKNELPPPHTVTEYLSRIQVYLI